MMSSGRLVALGRMSWVVSMFCCVTKTAAAENPVATHVIVGEWKMSETGQPLGLAISLLDQLSDRQKELLDSGFTTFSQLNLRTVSAQRKLVDEPTLTIACTVKYDLWQEAYELARIGESTHTAAVPTISEYGKQCMTANLVAGDLLDTLYRNGGTLVATLLVDQISAQKAGEIKEWLIRQQSGVMQNLFSHMLGDLKLTERVDVVVQVPPGAGGKREIEVKSSIGSR